MRCPYCHESIRVEGRFCPKCGQQIFGRPAGPVPSGGQASAGWTPPPPRSNTTSSDVIDIVLEEPAEATRAPSDAVGKTCPYCRFPVKEGEELLVCSACRVPHHADCWQENGGCTAYGCSQSPQSQAAGAETRARRALHNEWLPRRAAGGRWPGPLPPGARELLKAELEIQATNALILTVLQVIFCLGLFSLITLFWGMSILSQLKRLGLGDGPARGKAIAAIVISGVVMLAGLIMVTSMGGRY